MYPMCNIRFMTDYGRSWRIMDGHNTVWSDMRCRIPTYTGVVLTARHGAPHLFVARYDTQTLLWRVRGAHKELGRSCLLVLDCSGAWRDIGSYICPLCSFADVVCPEKVSSTSLCHTSSLSLQRSTPLFRRCCHRLVGNIGWAQQTLKSRALWTSMTIPISGEEREREQFVAGCQWVFHSVLTFSSLFSKLNGFI